MKYSRLDKKKPYESPSLRIHKLRFEGALLDLSADGHNQPAIGPWGAKRYQSIIDDSYTEQSDQSYDYDEESLF